MTWPSLWAVGGEESTALAPVLTHILTHVLHFPTALSLIAKNTHTQDFDFAYLLKLTPVFLNLFKFVQTLSFISEKRQGCFP